MIVQIVTHKIDWIKSKEKKTSSKVALIINTIKE